MMKSLHGADAYGAFFIWLLALVTTAVILIFGRLPGVTLLWRDLQNFGHAPAFVFIAIAMIGLHRHCSLGEDRLQVRHYCAIFSVCMLLGAGIEVFQGMVGRDASMRDLLTDALGTTTGLAGHAYWVRRTGSSSRTKYGLLALVLLPALIAAAPLGWSLAAHLQRQSRFPVLATFHSPLDLHDVVSQSAQIRIVTPADLADFPASKTALLVDFHAGPWPGVSFAEPTANWEAYHNLWIDIENPGREALNLILRVHDSLHNYEFDDRFNTEFSVAAGARTQLAFPLSAIRNAPRSRMMDMTRIAGITLFGNEDLAGQRLLIYRIWLE